MTFALRHIGDERDYAGRASFGVLQNRGVFLDPYHLAVLAEIPVGYLEGWYFSRSKAIYLRHIDFAVRGMDEFGKVLPLELTFRTAMHLGISRVTGLEPPPHVA